MNGCRRLVFGMAVVVGVLTAGRAQEAKGPGKAVLELAGEVEAGKDVAKKAAALGKQFRNTGAVMRLYNPRARGGLGFGPKGVGIEGKFIDMGEQPLTANALKIELTELKRVARINLVMAEITRGFAPEKPFLGRGKKEWERDLDALKSASQSLLKALDAGSPKDVQAASARINNACNNCHDGKK